MSLLRYFHTVRHMRLRQIAGQVQFRVRARFEDPRRFAKRPIPPRPDCKWPAGRDFLHPGAQNNDPDRLLEGRFTFLNSTQDLGWPPAWDASDTPKLWQYNLHYFEWLWPLDYEDAKAVALDWIERHGLQKNRVGWEPYPTSLRILNWLGVFRGKFQEKTGEDADFHQALWKSVYLQTEWLSRRLEVHLMGNHLLENGAALAFAGSCFQGPDARRWLDKGKAVLDDEFREQLPHFDSLHFELSPMYHLRIAYLLILLLETGDRDLAELARDHRLAGLLSAIHKVCHPDGRIALLNDSAFGIYNEPRDLITRGEAILTDRREKFVTAAPDDPFEIPSSGYYASREKDDTYIICDAGPIGPDYIPGHAHADIFSFELSLKGHRAVVDSGVYDYVPGEMRTYCRSTRAHNTVEINGLDQCEMWGAFRVARRGWPRHVQWEPSPEGFRLSAWHDGYQRLPGAPTHHREFTWTRPGRLEVRDRIESARPVDAVSRIHLHPDCEVVKMTADHAEVASPGGRFQIVFSGSGKLAIEPSYYCPEFGKKIENTALAFSFAGSNMETGFRIETL